VRREDVAPDADRPLIDALIDRQDEKAFRELYRRHTPALYQLLLRMLGGDDHDAEDIVQETWVQAVKSLAGFRGSSSFRTWLTAIGINRCRNLFRSRQRKSTVPLMEDWDPPAPVVQHNERIDLEKAIALLPDGYRAVLVLHDVEGYTHEEIAAQLGISPGTSKSQLFWARRAVRGLLDPTATRRERTHERRAEPERA
jgi:RNA polymerase sigma-70 factor, ECF subfamily